jgi:TIGR03009 family protein
MNGAQRIALGIVFCLTAVLTDDVQGQGQTVKVQPGTRQQRPPANRVAQAPANGAAPAQRPPVAPPANQPPKGFVLTAAQQAELDEMLAAWEAAGKAIDQFEVTFDRLEYSGQIPPGQKEETARHSYGEIKYKSPDKGLYIAKHQDTAAPSGEVTTEHWVTDGATIFEFQTDKKLLVAHQLPPQLQGKGIVDGPLPFLFGTEAAKLKARYWMRLLPMKEQDQVMLEAIPKSVEDRRDYVRAQVILQKSDLSMKGLQVFYPGGKIRKTHVFKNPKVNQRSPLAILQRDFSKPATPLGWKFKVEPAGGPPQNAGANAPAPPNNVNARQPRASAPLKR